MKVKLSLILIVISYVVCSTQFCKAQTYVSGRIGSDTWTTSGNPYYIDGDVLLEDGETLQLLPGVTVEFLDSYAFNVSGELLISGELGDSVQFIGDNMSELNFISSMDQSHIQFGYLKYVEISIETLPLTLHRCNLKYCTIDAHNTTGNVLTASSLNGDAPNNGSFIFISGGSEWTVNNNEFTGYQYGYSEWAGIVAVNNASGTFIANSINISASSSGGDYPWASAYGFSYCEGTFAHNTIYVSASSSPYSWNCESAGFTSCSGVCRHNCIFAGDFGIDYFTGDLFNNTIKHADYGINNSSGSIRNTIFYDCGYGVYGANLIEYSCFWLCGTNYAGGASTGDGVIYENPLLVQSWYLDPTSPCIDAGDPDPIYNDPDGTRDDMGANYFNQGYPEVNIDLTYVTGSPVPATGGNLVFDLFVENQDVLALNFDAWLEIAYEGGTPNTVVMRSFTNYLPGWTINRPGMYYPISSTYAAGNYTFTGKVGVNPDVAWDESGFPFVKEGTDFIEGFVPFPVDGAPDPFAKIYEGDIQISPTEFSMVRVFPNPFNPTTTMNYELREAGTVNLSVYDVSGREVMTLIDGWREAGPHSETFDGSNLPSGVYIYRLSAGDFTGSGKMVLMK